MDLEKAKQISRELQAELAKSCPICGEEWTKVGEKFPIPLPDGTIVEMCGPCADINEPSGADDARHEWWEGEDVR